MSRIDREVERPPHKVRVKGCACKGDLHAWKQQEIPRKSRQKYKSVLHCICGLF